MPDRSPSAPMTIANMRAKASRPALICAPASRTRSRLVLAAGRALGPTVPASTAVPAAAAKQQNDNYYDEKSSDVHVWLLIAVRFVVARVPLRLMHSNAKQRSGPAFRSIGTEHACEPRTKAVRAAACSRAIAALI